MIDWREKRKVCVWWGGGVFSEYFLNGEKDRQRRREGGEY